MLLSEPPILTVEDKTTQKRFGELVDSRALLPI
jgi:hypothetical protein